MPGLPVLPIAPRQPSVVFLFVWIWEEGGEAEKPEGMWEAVVFCFLDVSG